MGLLVLPDSSLLFSHRHEHDWRAEIKPLEDRRSQEAEQCCVRVSVKCLQIFPFEERCIEMLELYKSSVLIYKLLKLLTLANKTHQHIFYDWIKKLCIAQSETSLLYKQL